MNARPGSRRARQRGFTLIGLMFWAVVVGFAGYVAVRVLPTVNEYLTIQRTIDKIVQSPPATVPEIRAAFDKHKSVEYAITSISGKDLDITKVNGRVVIAYSYDKEIALGGPVFLLIRYEGQSP